VVTPAVGHGLEASGQEAVAAEESEGSGSSAPRFTVHLAGLSHAKIPSSQEM